MVPRTALVNLLSILSVALVACGGEGASDPGAGSGPPTVALLRLEPADSLTVVGLGHSASVRATAVSTNGAEVREAQVSWSLDDPSIASLSAATTKSGIVTRLTAVGRGRTTLRVAASGAVASIPVVIRAEVHRVVASASQVELAAIGLSTQVTATVIADTGVATGLTWRSTNIAVVSVSSSSAASGQGVTLTAIGAGSAQVLARSSADTTKFVAVSVTVPVPAVQDVRVAPAAIMLARGATAAVSATVIVQSGGSADVLWRSEDPTIATVTPSRTSSGGVVNVTALRPGMTRIVAASVQDPSRSAVADVTIPTPVVNAVTATPSSLTLAPLGTSTISASVMATAGASTDLFWRSSDPDIVSVGVARAVSGALVTITAVAAGQATIRAVSVEDTTKLVTVAVTVSAPTVQGIRITPTSSTIVRGATASMSATVIAPAGVGTDVAWRSEDPSMATLTPAVTSSGAPVTVTALRPGITRIRASSVHDPTQVVMSDVTIPVPQVSQVTTTPVTITLAQFGAASVMASITASPGAVTDVFWRSSNPAVATVGSARTASGVPMTVTAIAQGQAIVRAISVEDTTRVATIAVTVGPPAVSAVAVSLGAVSLDVGQTTQGQARLTDVVGNVLTGRAVTWTSAAPAIATVTSSGLVTAVGYGAAVIRASSEGQHGQATLSIQPRFASVTAGANHSCALALSGQLWCFGYGGYGAFGSGTPAPTFSLPLVRSFTSAPTLAQAVVGLGHTCGRTSAGGVWCAGDNQQAQLLSTAPVALAGGPAFTQLSGGLRHTCGLTSAGAAWCWGDNRLGQLGDGTATSRATPVPVAGGHVFTTVNAGFNHSCGRTTAGEVWCWGYNQYGQLGDNSTTTSFNPVKVLGALTFADVQVGAMHTCARTAAGFVWCWGANYHGQLGNGTTTDALAPVQVQSGAVTFDDFSLSSNHACGRTGTTLRCWGWNTSGGLGNGTIANAPAPVAVSSVVAFASVSAGNTHTCAVSTVGQLWCWGGSTTARPDGTVSNSAVPVLMR